MENKITLKEFFESEEELWIWCGTKIKAKKLLKEFDKLGKKWWKGSGDDCSYLKYDHYSFYKKITCYGNNGTYSNLYTLQSDHEKIYNFEDVIFED